MKLAPGHKKNNIQSIREMPNTYKSSLSLKLTLGFGGLPCNFSSNSKYYGHKMKQKLQVNMENVKSVVLYCLCACICAMYHNGNFRLALLNAALRTVPHTKQARSQKHFFQPRHYFKRCARIEFYELLALYHAGSKIVA